MFWREIARCWEYVYCWRHRRRHSGGRRCEIIRIPTQYGAQSHRCVHFVGSQKYVCPVHTYRYLCIRYSYHIVINKIPALNLICEILCEFWHFTILMRMRTWEHSNICSVWRRVPNVQRQFRFGYLRRTYKPLYWKWKAMGRRCRHSLDDNLHSRKIWKH